MLCPRFKAFLDKRKSSRDKEIHERHSSLRLSILAVAALALASFCSAQAKLAGDWQGTYVDANGITFDLVWHVTAAPDGTLTSTLDNVDAEHLRHKSQDDYGQRLRRQN